MKALILLQLSVKISMKVQAQVNRLTAKLAADIITLTV